MAYKAGTGHWVWACAAILALGPIDRASPEEPSTAIQHQIDQALNREQQRRQTARQRHAPEMSVFLPKRGPEPLEPGQRAGGRCIQVQGIRLEGASLLSEGERRALLAPYLQRCLGAIPLRNLLKALNNAYLDKGYITSRAYLKAQDVRDGQLVVHVIEGQVESVRMTPEAHPRHELITAFPGLTGKPLNLRDLEQGTEQMNRLPSNDARLDLVPGAHPGATQVVVNNRPGRRYRLRVNADNYGGDGTGRIQLGIELQVDNPLGLNDQLGASLNGTTKQASGQGAQGYGLYYALPYGYWSLDLGANRYRYRQTIRGANETFRSTGESTSAYGRIRRMLRRGRSNKTEATLGLSAKNNRNLLEDVLIETSSQRLTIASLSLRHLRLYPGGELSITGGYHRGLPWLGADRDSDTAGGLPHPVFDKFTLDILASRGFALGALQLVGNARIRGQYAPDALFGTEQIFVGGPFTVRGFHDQGIGGDTGWYSRNEISVLIPWSVRGSFSRIAPYLALDAGGVRRETGDDRSTGLLAGAALGLRTHGGPLSMDLSVATALAHPGIINPDRAVFSSYVSYLF
jgi:hemolysin activation/secretion protein